ncbi:MAG: VWA domain-containing protein [Planctomycetes bacterium]|nr:VWA domain-containing protein [Planctomycetota bacterium]
MINPLLLWFLPVALVPIALHLITLYRLRTVELSTYRFLMESYVQQRRRVKLLEYLLMLLRTLFVLLIVLTMARPVVDRFASLFGSQAGRDVMLVIDSGATMGLRTGGTTALERAKAVAKTVINQLGPGDHVTLIRAAHKPDVVVSAYASKPLPMLEALDAIKTDLTPADVPAAIGEALAQPPHGPRIVYVISDAQKRAWSVLREHPVLRKIDDETRLVVMNVGASEPVANLAVVGDPPRAGRPVVGLPVMLTATVAAGRTNGPVDARLAVVLDDQQVSQVDLNLQPGQKLTRAITIVPTHAGIVRGRFELPPDAFTDDDRYLFTLNVEPQINVLLITAATNVSGESDPKLYIRAALRAPLLARDTGGTSGNEEQRIAESLALTQINENQINDPQLANADVVIMADVSMDANRGRMLRKYVEDGGGLFVFAGPHVVGADYSKHLITTETISGSTTPLWFDAPVGDPDNEATFVPIATLDLHHPVLSAFESREDKNEFFGTVRLYRYFPIAMSGGQNTSTTMLMRLADRRGAMAEMSIGRGRVMLAGFAATPDWSNLPLKPEFVPLLLRSVAHLRRDAQIRAVDAVRPHEPAPIQLADRWANASVQVVGPDDRPQALDMQRSDDRMVGALMSTDRKGYYTFSIQPPRDAPGQMKTEQRGFAVNLDMEDAGFEPMNEANLRAIFEPHKLVYLAGSPDDPVLTAQLTERKEIWRALIWTMFAVIGLEFLLSTLKPTSATGSTGGGMGSAVRRFAERLGARSNVAPPKRRDLAGTRK